MKIKIDTSKFFVLCETCRRPLDVVTMTAEKMTVKPCRDCMERAKLNAIGFKPEG